MLLSTPLEGCGHVTLARSDSNTLRVRRAPLNSGFRDKASHCREKRLEFQVGLYFIIPNTTQAFTKKGAYLAASKIASAILISLTIPFPAISNAVPWSTEVRRMGMPLVMEMVRSKSRVLVAMWP